MRRVGHEANCAVSLSIPQVDLEHQEMLELARALKLALEAGFSRHECHKKLCLLIKSTEIHFSSEEQLMLSSRYPGYQAHKTEHARLLAQLQLVEKEFASRAVHPCGALSTFLEVSAVHHMRGPDKHFAVFLSQRTPAGQGRCRKCGNEDSS